MISGEKLPITNSSSIIRHFKITHTMKKSSLIYLGVECGLEKVQNKVDMTIYYLFHHTEMNYICIHIT